MRDMDLEMGGSFSRLDAVLAGRQLHDGYELCEGGCGKFVLGAFCRDCRRMNMQMEAKRLADLERGKVFQKMKRTDAGIAEYDAKGADRMRVTDNPLAMLGVGLAVTIGAGAAFWYGIPLVIELGLWLSAHGV